MPVTDGVSRGSANADHCRIRVLHSGEKALREKQFDKAVCAFSLALKHASKDKTTSPAALNTLLDLRTEAQIQSKDSAGAFQDAFSMVHNDREDARGYLRCGQLYRMKNEYTIAQKWYEQGVKHVAPSAFGFEQLVSMHAKSASKSTSTQRSKLCDPFVSLPVEIIQIVLSYLNFRQATISLGVCRNWRSALLATDRMWRTLDFRGSKKNIRPRHLKACLERLAMPPTTAHFHALTPSAVTYLQTYLQRWSSIQHLSVNVHGLTRFDRSSFIFRSELQSLHVGANCAIDFSVVHHLLHHHLMLQHARFDHVPLLYNPEPCLTSPGHVHPSRLAHLELSNEAGPGWWAGASESASKFEFFARMPHLEVLRCTAIALPQIKPNVWQKNHLRHLSLIRCRCLSVFTIPSSVETFIYRDCALLALHPPEPAEPALRNLKVVELRELSEGLSSLDFQDSLALTRLEVTDCKINRESLRNWLDHGKATALAFLKTSSIDWTDSDMQRLADRCAMLETVDLDGALITGVSIKELCVRTAVKTIRLSNCPRVSPDVIEWARVRSVAVTFQRTAECCNRPERRVRYGD